MGSVARDLRRHASRFRFLCRLYHLQKGCMVFHDGPQSEMQTSTGHLCKGDPFILGDLLEDLDMLLRKIHRSCTSSLRLIR